MKAELLPLSRQPGHQLANSLEDHFELRPVAQVTGSEKEDAVLGNGATRGAVKERVGMYRKSRLGSA